MNNAETELTQTELQETWSLLSPDERLTGFKLLASGEADDFFLDLSA